MDESPDAVMSIQPPTRGIPPTDEAEGLQTFLRREELGKRLKRFEGLPNNERTWSAMKRTIAAYITELELKGEIPHGLVPVVEGDNDRRDHILVRFQIKEGTPKSDLPELLGYLSGRRSFI